jgi:hypothetical protein
MDIQETRLRKELLIVYRLKKLERRVAILQIPQKLK